ncbi:MAG: hypothetical protein J6O50_02780 [Ruminiclostridium sp.]|nr:hypothetical protein [Ruminiclostridium sp.]
MEDEEFHKWMSEHYRALDRKYYHKGIPILILHRRAATTAFSVIWTIKNIDVADLLLTGYFMIKDIRFYELARKYENMLELAKINKEQFLKQIYGFYMQSATVIRKDGLFKRFLEFISFFQNDDRAYTDEVTCSVYRAYIDLLLCQCEFLKPNKFDVNKMTAGVTTDGVPIETNSAYMGSDAALIELEHDIFARKTFDPNRDFGKYFAKYGYNVTDVDSASLLATECRNYNNTILSLSPYINEFTADILPGKGFDPQIMDYLNDIPAVIGDFDFKSVLRSRRRTLPSNGIRIHLEKSRFYREMLLKEIYYDDAVICLFRLETKVGETAGFYNTQTGKFSSSLHMNTENVHHFGDSVERLILWAYSAFVTDVVQQSSESYRSYLDDRNCNVVFAAIPGKLRIPTGYENIRTIAGDDRYETVIMHINGYIRKLPKGHKASDKASAAAEALGYSLDENETFVCPFERITWICRTR